MNYNTLINKPTINYRELIGDNTVSEVGGITEEQFNTLLNTDLTSYYTKAQIDDLFSRSYVYREKSGSIVTFDCPESTTSGISEVTSEIVAVQSGTGDPSPTNVRPFSGWSAVDVYDTGKNLYKAELNNYYLDTTTGLPVAQAGYEVSGFIPILANQSIYIPDSGSARRWFYDKFKNPKTYLNNSENQTYTAQEDGYIRVTLNKNISAYSTYQIEYGTTATDFEPYNGQTYTIDLGGTRYGCTLDVVSGELTVTDEYIASYNGETLPATWISDRDVYAEGTTPTTGAEVVYELATPQTIQLTPTAVKSLLGTNNIWADTGDITVNALDKIIQG